MMQDLEHENYILNSILKSSPSSENFSFEEYRKVSPAYYEDLKEQLLLKYQDRKLTDIEGSKVISTPYGDTLEIVQKEKIDFKLAENNFKNQMNHNLKLLPKIGIKTEENLKKQGFDTIESLLHHDSHKDNAKSFLENMEDMSFMEIIDLLNQNRYGKSCRDNLIKCVSIPDYENFKFMDIETLGLSNVPIILIGVAEIKGNNIISSQYFLRDLDEEIAVLKGYFSHLDEDSVHVTFNGKTFDVPYIKNRLNYHRIDVDFDLAHLDLMYFAKYLWRDELPNCQLQTIEKYKFGLERVDDVPGQYIPGYYNTYLSERNIGPMIPIIEHNRQDIVSLADFLMKMYEEVNYE
ncbi:MAG: ribonuclease H-like domain-containing protein [Methanobrevibacter sp.]|nr:ribonuclease H-like domain-containing protein [Methanobrevibacter sp.]MBR0371010.1 ribonuclease H-like domain-containing protein [Methanobrevibacter sp.]